MDWAYIDTETTGLREPHLPGGRRTWEYAVVRVSETPQGRLVRAAWAQIIDVDLTHADPASLNIGRFYQRWSRRPGGRYDTAEADLSVFDGGILPDRAAPRTLRLVGVTEAEAARQIEELTRGAVLVGSNPAFDAANFTDLLTRNGLAAGAWYHHHRDIPNMATGWLLGRRALVPYVDDEFLDHALDADHDPGTDWTAGSYSTRVLSEACGIPEPADRHSAWADTVWMYQWDQVLRGRASAQPADGAQTTIAV
jgi:hypothetical protein